MSPASNSAPRAAVACVHGRFQPFHLGHLEYVLSAFGRSELLYVGLSNADPLHTDATVAADHRHLPSSNPFPYYARMDMVLGSLREAGADLDRIRVVPFPINRPDLLVYYVPRSAVHLITIYDEWGEEKLRALRNQGLQVEVMWRRDRKVTTGREVRERLRRGQAVDDLVPPYVASFLRHSGVDQGMDIRDR